MELTLGELNRITYPLIRKSLQLEAENIMMERCLEKIASGNITDKSTYSARELAWICLEDIKVSREED